MPVSEHEQKIEKNIYMSTEALVEQWFIELVFLQRYLYDLRCD